MVLSNTFISFVVILLGHVAFLRFNVFFKDCTLLGSAGSRKDVFSGGFPWKFEYFLSVSTILLFIFLVIVVKNLLK